MTITKASDKLTKKNDKSGRSVEDRVFPGFDGAKKQLDEWNYLLKKTKSFHDEFQKLKYMQDPNMAMCREKAWDIHLRVENEQRRLQRNIDEMTEFIVKQTTKR